MSPIAVSGQILRIYRHALDSLGKECPNGGNAPTSSSAYGFIDDQGVTWAINSFSGWDANGYGTFDLIIPTVSEPTQRTITRYVNGTPFPANPDPLTVSLLPAYRGKFNLTGALVASDMTPNTSDRSVLFDYSGNGRGLHRWDNAAMDSNTFTNTSYYKTSASGSQIVLGRECVSQKSNMDDANLMITDTLLQTPFIGQNSLPPAASVVEGIFWVNILSDMDNSLFFLNFKRSDASAYIHVLEVGIDRSKTLKLYGGGNRLIDLGSYGLTPLNVFNEYVAIHVALRLEWNSWSGSSGIPVVSVYINGTKRIAYDLTHSISSEWDDNSVNGWANHPSVILLPWNYMTSRVVNYPDKRKTCLDFAVYPSTHTDAQILANAAAWGLA